MRDARNSGIRSNCYGKGTEYDDVVEEFQLGLSYFRIKFLLGKTLSLDRGLVPQIQQFIYIMLHIVNI